MPFASQVNVVQAPAVEGDSADKNPRVSVDSSGAAFVAGVGGVLVGRFAWADFVTGMVTNAGAGPATGFVMRSQQALITQYLAEYSMVIPQGQPVTLHSHGGFWVKNTGVASAAIGAKAFASNTTGQIQFGAAGATIAGYSESKWTCLSTGLAGELVKITSWPLG
jgi:hypothetical protein